MTANIGRAFLFSLTVLFLLGGVFAVKACQCSTVPSEFTFVNNHDTVEHYTIQKGGIPASWSTVTPSSFTLRPGESKVVVAFSRIDCNTPAGLYSLTIKAISENDNLVQSVDFDVSSCRSVSVLSDSSSYESCVNRELVIPFNVSNDGDYTEFVNLSASVGVLSQDYIILGRGESQSVNLILRPDTIRAIPVSVNAVFSDGSYRSSIVVNAVECAFFNATLSSDYVSLCENEESVVKLRLKNDGSARTYFFNSSSSVVDVPDSARLNPNEELVMDVTVYSGCARGVVNPVISVWTDGSRIVSLPVVVNLRGCYQPIIVSSVKNDVVCACESVNYSFMMYNPGDRAVEYVLSPSFGSVYLGESQVSSVTLPVDGSVNLTLRHVVPCDYSGEMVLSLNVTSVNSCVKSSSDAVVLRVNAWHKCEAVSVNAPRKVSVNESQLTVPVVVSNIGIRPASYNILVSGSALNNLLGVTKSFLTLLPGESEVIELTVTPEGITGDYLNVQAFSLDNLASSSVVIGFGDSFVSESDLYFILIPAGVAVIMVSLFFRRKFFNRSASTKSDGKELKIRKAELKK